MRHLAISLAAFTVAGVVLGADRRTLELNRPAEGIEAVEIDAGVGDVSVTADVANAVTAHVEVSPKGRSFWGARSQEIESLEISNEVHGSTLVLRLRPENRHDGGFG